MDMKSRNSNNQSVLRFRSYQLTSVRNRIRQKNINEKMDRSSIMCFVNFIQLALQYSCEKFLRVQMAQKKCKEFCNTYLYKILCIN